VLPGSHLEIHRGDMEGPLIAEGRACRFTPGTTDLRFLDDPRQTIELEHVHHEESHTMTRFTFQGREYYWKGYSELINVESEKSLVEFFASLDGEQGLLGKLVLRLGTENEGKRFMDAAVISALVVQDHYREARAAEEDFTIV